MNRSLVNVALVVILLAAFLLRFPRLADVPPGLFYDEASDGIDVARVARGEQFPIFFEANAGREPLFNYLQAAAVLTLGLTPFALRVVAVFAGVLTIPLVFVLTKQLTQEDKRRDWIALLAAAGVATCFWHLDFSRLGQRAILLPLLLTLSFCFFWRARVTNRLRDWILSGFWLGVSFYTYIPSRLAPIVLLLFILAELFEHPRPIWPWLYRRLLLFATALIVFAPLGNYFLSNPGAFFGRAQDVALAGSGSSGLLDGLASNVMRVARMFLIEGDLEWRHNFSGRPVLDWITAAPFLIGLLISLRHIRRPGVRFTWLWLLLMLVPTILSQGAPDFARAIGALPPIFILVAWGWAGLLSSIERLVPRLRTVSAVAFLLLALVGSGWMTAQDYFVRWANDKRVYKDFEGGMTELANWVNASQAPVYVPLQLYAHPTLRFLTMARFPLLTSDLSIENAAAGHGASWVIPADPSAHNGEYILLSGNQAIFQDSLPLRDLKPDAQVIGRYGPIAALAQVIGSPFLSQDQPPPTQVQVDFANGLRLAGYRAAPSSGGMTVTLYWQLRQRPSREAKLFIHWFDARDKLIGQADESPTGGFSSLDWPVGPIVPDAHWIPSAVRPQPGDRLEVGLYDLFNGDRLDVRLDDATIDDHVWLSLGGK